MTRQSCRGKGFKCVALALHWRYVYSILGGQLKHVQSFANPAIEPPAIRLREET